MVSRKKTGSDSLFAITTHTISFIFVFICVLGVVVKLGKVLVLIQSQRKPSDTILQGQDTIK